MPPCQHHARHSVLRCRRADRRIVGERNDDRKGVLGQFGLGSAPHPLATLDLTAATNPSGSLIVVDSNLAPYVRKPFLDMKEFIDYANSVEGAGLHTLTVTGVGSSAFGSVAFAWDVSVTLGEPVVAIVPGYGLADVVPQ